MDLNKNLGLKIATIVLGILTIATVVILILTIIDDFKTSEEKKVAIEEVEEELETESFVFEIEKNDPVTLASDSRPIAVMLDNNIKALPQAGLLEADIIYEIIVEGGESRLMLILDEQTDLDKIGPVRSSRHYFLDYALENDAVYVHYGWSPQAQSDISTLKVNNINGITQSSTSFWRVTDKSAPHNVVTSYSDIIKIATNNNYRLTSTQDTVFKYVGEEIIFDNDSSAIDITIPYSTSNTVTYEYDEELGEYIRYSRGVKQVDWETGVDITTKNIIIQKIKNYDIGDGSARQTISNITTSYGYYITNGEVIEIKCIKAARSSQTIYQDLDGNEIEINDGKTFVQIVPLDSNIQIQ